MSDSTTLIPVLKELMEEYTEEQGSYEEVMQVDDREDENESNSRREKSQEKQKGELIKPE